jgi:hypothetical protein
MTEAEWLACDDPSSMLPLLTGRGTGRMPMLFSAACLRRVWHLVTDERSRGLIESTELFLDGIATEEEVGPVFDAFEAAYLNGELQNEGSSEIDQAVYDLVHIRFDDAVNAANHVACAIGDFSLNPDDELTWEGAFKAEKAAQAELLRDVFGNPFRPVTVDPAWRTPAVTSLAQAAYEERILPAGHLDPQRLSVLADSLEEAGCTDQAILEHLRGPGPHTRGCWPVDLLLGRE